MNVSSVAIIALLLIAAVASAMKKKLTYAGAATGWLIATVIYISTGVGSLLLMTLFFIAGTIATSIGRSIKQKTILQEDKNGRSAWQVWANAGVAFISSCIVLLVPSTLHLMQIAIAGSFSAATADTLSSELGNVYGKRFYNILTFKKDTRGLDGVVSLEGSLAGLVGSLSIAILYYCFDMNAHLIWIVVFAGTAGNLLDSILGALFERKHLIGNNTVNLLNTLAGALIATIAFSLFL